MRNSRTKQEIKFYREWDEIRIKYPSFAKSYLAQNIILVETVGIDSPAKDFIINAICSLSKENVPVIFQEFWEKHCEHVDVPLTELLKCIADSSDPTGCFNLKNDDWFSSPERGFPVKFK